MTRALVFVDLPDGRTVQAGQIEGIDTAPGTMVRTTFAYTEDFLADPARYPLSPELPLVSGSQSTASDRIIFGGIADAGPDSWGRRLINVTESEAAAAEGRGRRTLDDLDLVLAVQDVTRLGALRFRLPDGDSFVASPAGEVPAVVDLPEILAAVDRVERGEPLNAHMRRLLAAGTTMGGARPKATIRDEDGSLAVAKFPQETDRWDVEAWEWATWQMARDARIAAAPARLIRLDPDRSIFLQTRFDRTGDDRRVGYISAATLLERPARALAASRPATYVELAEALQDAASDPRDDARQLLRRVAFTILVGNTDDHLWNHGLLRGERGWHLSPAFDVNPHPLPTGGSTLLSDTDGGERSIDTLIESASSYGMSRDEARAIVREVADATEHWRPVALSAGIEDDAVGRMTDAFEGPNRQAVTRISVPMDASASSRARRAESGGTWVRPHVRGGRPVSGRWRADPSDSGEAPRD